MNLVRYGWHTGGSGTSVGLIGVAGVVGVVGVVGVAGVGEVGIVGRVTVGVVLGGGFGVDGGVTVGVLVPPPPLVVTCRGLSVTAKEMVSEVAALYIPSVVMVACNTQVPVDLNDAAPLLDAMVQIDGERLVKDIVPLPTDGVAVMVGGF